MVGQRDLLTRENVLLITPNSSTKLNFKELCDHRDLLFFLCLRNIKVRYKQTILGVLWAVIQPVMTMLIFSLFFGRILGFSSEGVPYPIYVFAGLIPWLFFSQGFTQASNSLVGQADVIKKVYFPRLLIPVSEILAGIPDFLIGIALFLCLSAYHHIFPSMNLLFFPLGFLQLLVTCFGVSLWFSSINVLFRDIRHAVTFITQIWMFVTPIIYPISYLSPFWVTAYCLNPMVGTVEVFRWILLGETQLSSLMLLSSLSVSYLIFFTGLIFFKRMEAVFADVV